MDTLIAMIARSGASLLGALTSPRLSILIFHRVHAQADSIFPNEPDAARFERLMRFVATTYRVMTLGEALTYLAQDNLPSRALVITFDDGYADNAETALPILQRYGLLATFFVSTGFLDGGRMWNDSVIECLRDCYLPEIDLASFGLGKQSLRSNSERRQALGLLLPIIKYLTLAEREEAISRLQRLCEVKKLPTDLMMTSEQVQKIHQAGMEVGAHTVNHPILTAISLTEAEYEIEGGRKKLQSIIDAPVDVFAYPNGKPNQDYDHHHVSLLKRLGFRGAVSTAPGIGRSGDDLFQLPRYTPWENSLPIWGVRLLSNHWNTGYTMTASNAQASH